MLVKRRAAVVHQIGLFLGFKLELARSSAYDPYLRCIVLCCIGGVLYVCSADGGMLYIYTADSTPFVSTETEVERLKRVVESLMITNEEKVRGHRDVG